MVCLSAYPIVKHKEILALLRQNKQEAINLIINIYGAGIMKRALIYLKNKELAEDIAQEVYMSIWEKRNQISISSSLSGYLSVTVRNKCLNHIKSNSRVRIEDDSALSNKISSYTDSHSQLEVSEMSDKIMDLISELPEKCRIVFEMSRFDHLTNAEIADRVFAEFPSEFADLAAAATYVKTTVARYSQ